MNSKVKIILILMILTMLLLTACGGNSLTGASTYSDVISDDLNTEDCPSKGDTCPIDFGTNDFKDTCGTEVSDDNKDGICDIN